MTSLTVYMRRRQIVTAFARDWIPLSSRAAFFWRARESGATREMPRELCPAAKSDVCRILPEAIPHPPGF
jgi:hypothetical protein